MGITQQQLNDFEEELLHPGRYDVKEVVYIKRLLQHALPIPIRKEIIYQLFYKFVSNDEGDFSKSLYLKNLFKFWEG